MLFCNFLSFNQLSNGEALVEKTSSLPEKPKVGGEVSASPSTLPEVLSNDIVEVNAGGIVAKGRVEAVGDIVPDRKTGYHFVSMRPASVAATAKQGVACLLAPLLLSYTPRLSM